MNTSSSPSRSGNSPAKIKDQGVYADVAKWRRQQTLTKKQLDPVQNSADRRELYKCGTC